MAQYEYKVIPAPTKGEKAQGIKAPEARMANTVQVLLNAQASEGWEYLRTDILPSDERQGLTSTQTVYRTLMIFRRAKAETDKAADDLILTAQSVAEATSPISDKSVRREPSLASAPPPRAEPVKTPVTPDPAPDAPEPQTPEKPEKPDPQTPTKDD